MLAGRSACSWRSGTREPGTQGGAGEGIPAETGHPRSRIAVAFGATGPLLPRSRRGAGGAGQPSVRSARGRILATPAGFEPATYRLGICRSIRLSYGATLAR